MSQSVLYNTSQRSINNIAHSTCPIGIEPSAYQSLILETNNNPSTLAANKPLVLPSNGNNQVSNFHRLKACSRKEHEVLANLSNCASGAAVMGLASFLWESKIPEQADNLVTFGGSGMGASTAASSALLGAIDRYDRALAHYEQLKNHRAAPRTLHGAELQAKRVFDSMNSLINRQAFGYLNNINYKMRTTTNLNGRKVTESIPIHNNTDVQKLAKLAKAGRVLGPGVILLDGYLRANKVHHMYASNNPNWKRERFVQTGAFIGGIVAGVAIGMALAPAGIIIALFAGGAAGLLTDKIVQGSLRKIYDEIIDE